MLMLLQHNKSWYIMMAKSTKTGIGGMHLILTSEGNFSRQITITGVSLFFFILSHISMNDDHFMIQEI